MRPRVGAVAQAGRSDVLIISEYEQNQAMLDMTKRGDILGFATQYVVDNGTIAVDQAIRAIEKKPMMTFVKPIPDMVTKETLPQIKLDLTFAPADFKPVFTVGPIVRGGQFDAGTSALASTPLPAASGTAGPFRKCGPERSQTSRSDRDFKALSRCAGVGRRQFRCGAWRDPCAVRRKRCRQVLR